MKTKLILFAVVCAAAAVATFCAVGCGKANRAGEGVENKKPAVNSPSHEASKNVIRIGVILPLTGEQDTNGQDCRAAVQMRLDEQSAKKNSKYEYRAIFEDGQNIPRVSVEAFWKLKSADKADAVLTIMGAAGSPVATSANSQKIVHIGSAWSSAVAKPPYSFNNLAAAKTNAAMMAEFLKRCGFKRIAMISQQNASTNTLEAAFLKIAPENGFEIVSVQKFAPPEKDFRVAILKVREAKPDVVFVNAFDPEAGIIIRQMKEIAYRAPITAMGQWGANQTDLIDGIPWVDFVIPQEFAARLKAKTRHYPSVLSGPIYDSTGMIIQVCENYGGTGKPTADDIAKGLRELKNYSGVMGKLTPDENGWFEIPATMAIKHGEEIRAITMEEAVGIMKKIKEEGK